jgi:spermidine synthase
VAKRRRPRIPSTPSTPIGLRRRVLAACLVASGAAALTYEVIWLRELSLVMGSTVYALAAVLDAFLGGLALGAWLGGRLVARRGASLALYAGLEAGIGLTAVGMPWAIGALSPIFGVAYRSLGDQILPYGLVQFVACGALLLVPTILMGATLPVVTALLLEPDSEVAGGAGRLYAANSLGGAIGAGLAGFVLLPSLGLLRTGFAAAAVNFLVAATATWLGGRPGGESVAPAPPRDPAARAAHAPGRGWPAPPPWLLVLLYGVSGFAALALEVGWARIVGLSIGSTTHGFTIILVTFIVGLAGGSWLVPRFRSARERPVQWIVGLHAVVAIWGLLTLSYLGSLPERVAELVGQRDLTFGGLIAAETMLVGLTIVIPTVCMGGAFPLVSALASRTLGSPGRAVGSAYAANTLGNILGSGVAGFVLVPAIGMRSTIVLACLLFVAVALAYLVAALRAERARLLRAAVPLVAAAALAAALAPRWNRQVVTSGPYLYGSTLVSEARKVGGRDAYARALDQKYEILDYREGAATVVTVKRRRPGGGLELAVGGKSDAYSFASTQNLIGHLPMLLHPGAKDVLVVGLGSGTTLGSVLTHEVESVDCVEISSEVVEMAERHFAPFTNDATKDPRANVIVADGRNHLRHSGRTYDVIVSQPSNPWMSGAAGLFTLEYFQEVREHLEAGGVACSWFMVGDDKGETMKSVLASWRQVFPNAWLFETRLLGEHVLVGLRDDAPIAAADIERALRRPEVRADLARISVTDTAEALAYVMLGPEGVARYSEGAVLNTDDNAWVEMHGPRRLATEAKVGVTAEIAALRESPADLVTLDLATPAATEALRTRLGQLRRSRDLVQRARQIEQVEGRTAAWTAVVREASQLDPRDPYVATSQGAAAPAGSTD